MSVPSVAHSIPKPMLTVDRVRALLDAGGYESTIVAAQRQQELPVGCSVMLEFGDRITRDADGAMRMPIQCSVVLNGSTGLVAGITRWRIGKELPMMVGQDRLVLAIDADLLLGNAVGLNDVLLQGGEVFRHLHLLLADARATLSSLPVDERRGGESPPRLRIDARFAADLAVGRCGLVRQRATGAARSAAEPLRATPHQMKAGMAACDGLADCVLPDLARAMRATIGLRGDRAAALQPRSNHENYNGEKSHVRYHN